MEMSTMYIGNSLSMCVKEILEGKISQDNVVCIIASTRFPDIQTAIERYSSSYWKDFNEGEILAIMIAVWPKVLQPRMWDERIEPNISGQERWIVANVKRMPW